jgi:sulfonate dioxygenase
MEEHPPVGGDTAWVSQYGLYDSLSDSYKKLFEGLHSVHTSRLQYDTILDLWGSGARRPPIDSHHPAVRTHPVTGLKAFNVNEGFVTGFAELKKPESGMALFLVKIHLLNRKQTTFLTSLFVTFILPMTSLCVGSGKPVPLPSGIIV